MADIPSIPIASAVKISEAKIKLMRRSRVTAVEPKLAGYRRYGITAGPEMQGLAKRCRAMRTSCRYPCPAG
jgi:hypothetical protein